jgi:hypothetical protein
MQWFIGFNACFCEGCVARATSVPFQCSNIRVRSEIASRLT